VIFAKKPVAALLPTDVSNNVHCRDEHEFGYKSCGFAGF